MRFLFIFILLFLSGCATEVGVVHYPPPVRVYHVHPVPYWRCPPPHFHHYPYHRHR